MFCQNNYLFWYITDHSTSKVWYIYKAETITRLISMSLTLALRNFKAYRYSHHTKSKKRIGMYPQYTSHIRTDFTLQEYKNLSSTMQISQQFHSHTLTMHVYSYGVRGWLSHRLKTEMAKLHLYLPKNTYTVWTNLKEWETKYKKNTDTIILKKEEQQDIKNWVWFKASALKL